MNPIVLKNKPKVKVPYIEFHYKGGGYQTVDENGVARRKKNQDIVIRWDNDIAYLCVNTPANMLKLKLAHSNDEFLENWPFYQAIRFLTTLRGRAPKLLDYFMERGTIKLHDPDYPGVIDSIADALDYAAQFKPGRWPALEVLIRKESEKDDVGHYIVKYSKHIGERWYEEESTVLLSSSMPYYVGYWAEHGNDPFVITDAMRDEIYSDEEKFNRFIDYGLLAGHRDFILSKGWIRLIVLILANPKVDWWEEGYSYFKKFRKQNPKYTIDGVTLGQMDRVIKERMK